MRVTASLKVITRYEYRVERPVYQKDIFDAIKWAQSDGRKLGQDMTFDNSVEITPEDDAICVWFEVSEDAPPSEGRPRCTATVRCGLDEHSEGGLDSHCANPSRGDGSTWTGDGFLQWKKTP